MRIVTLILAWAALLAAAALALVRWGGDASRSEDEVVATRFLVFPLDEPVVFPLEKDETRVKLVTWLSRPPRQTRDTRETALYRLEADAIDRQGQVVESWALWRRTRRSFQRMPDGLLTRPARLVGRPDEVYDDRLSLFDLTGTLPEGGALALRAGALPSGGRVLMAAFHERPRAAASRERIRRGAAPELRAEGAEEVSPFGWDALPEAWREEAVATWWERLGARDARGSDLDPIRLETTFHRSPWDDAPSDGVPVPPGGAVAYNLETNGTPISFEANWSRVTGAPLREGTEVETELRVVHLDGRLDGLLLTQGAQIGPLTFDEDVVSVQIALSNNAPAPLLLRARTTSGGLDRAWGDPPRTPVSAEAEQALAPDLRNLLLHRVGLPEETSPLHYAVEDAREVFRVTFRTRMAPSPLPGFLGLPLRWSGTPPVAHVDALDSRGRTLARFSSTLSPVASIFERYTQADDILSASVAEPETRYVVPPAGATSLVVWVTELTDVSVRVRRPEYVEHTGFRDYGLPDDARVSGRYEPWARDRWHARVPIEAEALAADGREARVDAQVRFETRWPDADPSWMLPLERARLLADDDDGESLTARPQRALALEEPFQILAEPDADGVATEGARTRLSAAAARTAVPDSGRLRIDYRVTAEQVGREALVTVTGTPHATRIPATAGQLRIDHLAPGPARVTISGVSGLFLANGAGTPLWQARRVWALPMGERTRIDIPGGDGALTGWFYAPPGADEDALGRVSWSLDRMGRASSGMYENISDWNGNADLKPWVERADAWPLSFSGGALRPLHPLRVRLGDETANGGQLELRSEATTPLYIRLTSTWAEEAAATTSNWRLGSQP